MSDGNLVEALESAFHNVLSTLASQEHFNVTGDQNENKSSMEKAISNFLEQSRKLDIFFHHKAALLTHGEREDLEDLRSELQRKDQILQKLGEKYQAWKQSVNRSTGSGSSQASSQNQPSNSQANSQETSNN